MKFGRACVAAWVGFSVAASVAWPAAAQQQQKGQISDKSVVILMDYAWALTPEEFTTESNKIIRTDKNKFDQVKLPLDDAREVIRVGRLSAQAQMCELIEAQTANYEALMAREVARSKWTDQQLVFINKLHLFTVMFMTGQAKPVKEAEAGKALPKEAPAQKSVNCSEADKQAHRRRGACVCQSYRRCPGGKGRPSAVAKNSPAYLVSLGVANLKHGTSGTHFLLKLKPASPVME